MSSAHLDAGPGDIAELVLLPGDPLRARHIAQTLLDDVVEVNTRRNMLGYTGRKNHRRVSVIGSGMGIPSLAIYATELVRRHGVKTIVRIGTCGGLGDVAVGDLLLAQSASTDSNFNRLNFGGHDLAACADFRLLGDICHGAVVQEVPLRVANVFSTDCFYDGDRLLIEHLTRHGIVGIEMESAGLYGLAMREGVRALSVLTVSDHLQSGATMSPEQRETGLAQASSLVLESLCPLICR